MLIFVMGECNESNFAVETLVEFSFYCTQCRGNGERIHMLLNLMIVDLITLVLTSMCKIFSITEPG